MFETKTMILNVLNTDITQKYKHILTINHLLSQYVSQLLYKTVETCTTILQTHHGELLSTKHFVKGCNGINELP